jgi:predicted enzyme related to lactoylglutathione lyase
MELTMQHPNLILFYVEDPLRSAQFYEQMFDSPPVAAFPTYVAFEFPNGLTFSLWSVKAKDFVSGGSGHRAELAFMVSNEAAVRTLRERWHNAGVQIEQDLHEAVFGLTFVALDLDGHRIRVCTPDD